MQILAATHAVSLTSAEVLVQGGVLNLTGSVTARRSATMQEARLQSGAVRVEPHKGRLHG